MNTLKQIKRMLQTSLIYIRKYKLSDDKSIKGGG